MPENALRFTNVHYFAAGATLFGDEVKGAYQYPDLAYLGKFNHVPGFQNCTDCHNTHELEVKTESLLHLPRRRGDSSGHPRTAVHG